MRITQHREVEQCGAARLAGLEAPLIVELTQYEPYDAGEADDHWEPYDGSRQWVCLDVREPEHQTAEADDGQSN